MQMTFFVLTKRIALLYVTAVIMMHVIVKRMVRPDIMNYQINGFYVYIYLINLCFSTAKQIKASTINLIEKRGQKSLIMQP